MSKKQEVRIGSRGLRIAIVIAISGFVTLCVLVFRGSFILDPIAFRAGGLAVHWYGFIMAAAIAAGFWLAVQRLAVRNVPADQAETITWLAIIGGLAGARLGFVVQNAAYYTQHPLEILAVNHGGLSIHGAVIVGALVVISLVKRYKLRVFTIFDALAPAVLLGAIIGRLGNFFNYELYGYPTSLIWKMFVPEAYRLPGYESFAFFHPTFLYEMFLNGLMLMVILWFERSSFFVLPSSKKTGTVFLLTVAGYSVSRFIVEFFRIGAPIGAGVTLAQIVSVIVVVGSIGYMQIKHLWKFDSGSKSR